MPRETVALFLRKAAKYDSIVYDLLSPHLNGGKVLSVGCGEGKVERLLQERMQVDIVGAEVTKYKEQKIQTELYDGEKLPFAAKTFDTTMFVYMLHHSQSIEGLLKEAKRVTRGEIIILDHAYTHPISRSILKVYDYVANCLYGMPIPFNFLKIREWKRLFSKLQLEVAEASIPSSLGVFFKLKV